jgi:hypothetical protein
VQSKMYARTPRWELEVGYACLDAVPSARFQLEGLQLLAQSLGTSSFLKIV